MKMRQIALIVVRQYFQRLCALPEEQKTPELSAFATLKPVLLDLFVSAPPSVRPHVCSAIKTFATIVIECGTLPELPLLVWSLLSQDHLRPCARAAQFHFPCASE
jgi:hypothetical protein